MTDGVMRILPAAMLALLFLSSFAAVYGLLSSLRGTRRRIRLAELHRRMTGERPPVWLQRVCGVWGGSPDRWEEWGQLLSASGLRVGPLWYICLKRMSGFLLGMASAAVWMQRDNLQPHLPYQVWTVSLAAGAAAAAILFGDKHLLHPLKRYRKNRMVEEIFAVSRQLLYFSGSPLHLHGKLSRCLPYTGHIRKEWHLLLNDWYHDPEAAIDSFRSRLGTEEAHSFAETLQSMRLYDHDAYYDLLRQRIQDYKERLELLRDSRKESVSYVLFVLAGIPIMYTFQIFIHPWVQEGKRLFDSLG